jgi:hypothetical protein
VAVVIVLALGSACMFYGYVLFHLWREMAAKSMNSRMVDGITALPESSARQAQLDRPRAVRVMAARPQFVLFGASSKRLGEDRGATLSPDNVAIPKWPGTKDAA